MIFSTEKLPEAAREILKKWEVVEEDASRLSEAEVIMGWRITPEMIASAPKLKAIQTFSAGVDHLPFSAIPKGVRIFSNAGAYSVPVAEHAWALLLHLAKGINVMDKQKAVSYPRQLNGKTLLVLGAGGIGQEIARIGKCFGMKTQGISRHPRQSSAFDEVYGLESLDNLLPQADFIAVALPLNKDSRKILDVRRLSLIKKDCVMVNVGRGDVVDQEAIYDLLTRNPDFRYGTDVWWHEPQGEGAHLPFTQLENFAGTPHIAGGALKDTGDLAKLAASRNVAKFMETGKADNEVNVADYI
ncbi:2-hydroxyacid dehydrogenase [Tardisphaera miroshnichenkoae]